METTKLYQKFLSATGISTDTRTLQNGQLFFALKGDNFNGNKFAKKALEKASFAVIDEAEYFEDNGQYILVDNVLESLQLLATHHRQQLKIPIIAITGSNGKTTTKELIKSVLGTSYKTFATKGNLNNHIGVPLSLLSITQEHEMAIIEMGANHLNEINQLCKIALPNFGLITSIGKAHLEGFGSEKKIQEGKAELFEFLDAFGGRMFVNMNDFKIAEVAYFMQKVTTYGSGKFYNINGKIHETDPYLNVIWYPRKTKKDALEPEPIILKTQLIGQYNLNNVLAAVAVGLKFKVSHEDIQKGVWAYAPSNNRSQVIEESDHTIILDAYNANPSSMEAALTNFSQMKFPHKVAILGDMLELGTYSFEEHEKIVKLAQELELDKVVLVGKEFAPFNQDNILHFEDNEQTKEWFKQQKFAQSGILIKGSRGIALEKILE